MLAISCICAFENPDNIPSTCHVLIRSMYLIQVTVMQADATQLQRGIDVPKEGVNVVVMDLFRAGRLWWVRELKSLTCQENMRRQIHPLLATPSTSDLLLLYIFFPEGTSIQVYTTCMLCQDTSIIIQYQVQNALSLQIKSFAALLARVCYRNARWWYSAAVWSRDAQEASSAQCHHHSRQSNCVLHGSRNVDPCGCWIWHGTCQ